MGSPIGVAADGQVGLGEMPPQRVEKRQRLDHIAHPGAGEAENARRRILRLRLGRPGPWEDPGNHGVDRNEEAIEKGSHGRKVISN